MCLSDVSGMHRAGVHTDCNIYDESCLILNATWGTLAWGPPPPWAVVEQQPLPIAAPNPPLAEEADGFQD